MSPSEIWKQISVFSNKPALWGAGLFWTILGSGYSSLSLLEELPLDKVKLDKSLEGTANKRGVLQATIQLALGLKFQCCVEGIETPDAASFAAAQGCDQMQGYCFGHPQIIFCETSDLRIAS